MARRVFSGLSFLFPWDNGNHPFATISLLILSQKKRALTALLFIATRDTLDDIIRHVTLLTILFDTSSRSPCSSMTFIEHLPSVVYYSRSIWRIKGLSKRIIELLKNNETRWSFGKMFLFCSRYVPFASHRYTDLYSSSISILSVTK